MSKKRIGGGIVKRPNQGPRFRLMLELRHISKRLPQLIAQLPYSWNLVKILILVEVIINFLVIQNVKYTEIDWSTYMTQVGQIFNSSSSYNFNYSQIQGPTGPLVYPAGHVYTFYLLKELTDNGLNIRIAQYIYSMIYIAQLILVYKIYSHKRTQKVSIPPIRETNILSSNSWSLTNNISKVPPYIFLILCLTSYRVHSIYVLRLFNDPIAVLVAYASFYALLRKRHTLSAFLFSMAISVKMNILLFSPAFALIFYEDLGLIKSVKNAALTLGVQLVLAAPFLYTDPIAYLNNAFDFRRVFLFKWTVNWRFLEEGFFTSPQFFKILLYAHFALLFMVFFSRWINVLLKLVRLKKLSKMLMHELRIEDPILTLFIANFIGVACSRSLHYQFYIWYYHSLPMILWATKFSVVFRILLMGCIEYAWNEYPSTPFSSLLLHACHFLILIGLLTGNYARSFAVFRSEPVKKKPQKQH